MAKFDFPFINQTNTLVMNFDWDKISVEKWIKTTSNYFFREYFEDQLIISNLFNIILHLRENFLLVGRPTIEERIDILVESLCRNAKMRLQGSPSISKHIYSMSSKSGEYDKAIRDKMKYYLLSINTEINN